MLVWLSTRTRASSVRTSPGISGEFSLEFSLYLMVISFKDKESLS
jgi:hypothetical protein